MKCGNLCSILCTVFFLCCCEVWGFFFVRQLLFFFFLVFYLFYFVCLSWLKESVSELVSAFHPFPFVSMFGLLQRRSLSKDGRASRLDGPLSCSLIRWSIHWLQGSSVVTGETNALPWAINCRCHFFGLSSQMLESPLCLCHAEMNVLAGTSAACANRNLNTEQTAPPSSLCACDHQIIAGRGHTDLQVWGMGWIFLLGLTQQA